MARRARASRIRASAEAIGAPSRFVQRQIPYFDMLNDEQVTTLEAQVDWIIQEVGIAFRNDPVALGLWRAEGARIDDDVVRAPAD